MLVCGPLFIELNRVAQHGSASLQLIVLPMIACSRSAEILLDCFNQVLFGTLTLPMWLFASQKLAEIGCPVVLTLSNINPLLQKKAKFKPSKLPKAKLGVAHTSG